MRPTFSIRRLLAKEKPAAWLFRGLVFLTLLIAIDDGMDGNGWQALAAAGVAIMFYGASRKPWVLTTPVSGFWAVTGGRAGSWSLEYVGLLLMAISMLGRLLW